MRGYSILGLDNPKSLPNLGAVMRGAGCYQAHHIYYTGNRVSFGKTATDTQNQHLHTPITHVNRLLDVIPYNCVPIAVDLTDDAVCIDNFEHPERAFYIFGPEDGTLGKRITDKCRDTIYIPTKYCMNLAVSTQVVLYDRMMKRGDYYEPVTKGNNLAT